MRFGQLFIFLCNLLLFGDRPAQYGIRFYSCCRELYSVFQGAVARPPASADAPESRQQVKVDFGFPETVSLGETHVCRA